MWQVGFHPILMLWVRMYDHGDSRPLFSRVLNPEPKK